MATEPVTKRVVAFFDGQNLFHAAKRCFGHKHPNYDVLALAARVVQGRPDWQLNEVRFYTGMHTASASSYWHHYWGSKLAVLGSRGVVTYSRPLRYQVEHIQLPDGTSSSVTMPQEKGIDVRIALDVVRLARSGSYDVALIFSQDQDLSEAADEVRAISIADRRWLKVACAYPCSSGDKRRGINGTEWLRVDQAMYDACLDPIDYRPKVKV